MKPLIFSSLSVQSPSTSESSRASQNRELRTIVAAQSVSPERLAKLESGRFKDQSSTAGLPLIRAALRGPSLAQGTLPAPNPDLLEDDQGGDGCGFPLVAWTSRVGFWAWLPLSCPCSRRHTITTTEYADKGNGTNEWILRVAAVFLSPQMHTSPPPPIKRPLHRQTPCRWRLVTRLTATPKPRTHGRSACCRTVDTPRKRSARRLRDQVLTGCALDCSPRVGRGGEALMHCIARVLSLPSLIVCTLYLSTGRQDKTKRGIDSSRCHRPG